MTRVRSALLAGLIVLSVVAGAFGPSIATAQSDTVGYSYTGSGDVLVIDTSDVSGSFQVEYTTDEAPGGGTTVLYRNTFSASEIQKDRILFYNEGAYGTVNVTVSGVSGTPTFNTLHPGDTGVGADSGLVVGSTGGDADLQPDPLEQVAAAVRPQVPQLDLQPKPGTLDVNTTGTDASQTKLDIYQSAQNSKAGADNYHTTLDNYLQDTRTQARIIGKSAYIQALNNGSSKAAAKSEAKQAVADYYATKEKNLVSEYNLQVENYKYLKSTSENESGITQTQPQSGPLPGDYLHLNRAAGTGNGYTEQAELTDWRTSTYTTVNGDSVDVQQFQVTHQTYDDTDSYMGTGESGSGYVGPTTGNFTLTYGLNGVQNNEPVASRPAGWLIVRAPDSNYNDMTAIKPYEYGTKLTEIQTQNQQVQNDMDMLANNTYDAYQAGEINNTDLVDPYVLSSEYSAGNSRQAWAATQLTMLGQNSPENFDQMGHFNISQNGTQYRGVLFSQTNPQNGEFAVNNTYDAANITGTQYVVTDERMVELTGEFTITDIRDTNGERIENTTIEEKQYQTTNTTELKQLYEDLAQERAEIEAREQAMKQAAGGGGFLGGGSVSPIVAITVIGTLLAVVVLQD